MRILKISLLMVITTAFILGGVATATEQLKPIKVKTIDLTKKQKEIKLHGWLGVYILELSQEIREDLKVPTSVQGGVVYMVGKDTPAHKAGLQPGDIIQKVNGAPFKSTAQFGEYPPETTISLEVWRKNESKTINATLTYRDADLGIITEPQKSTISLSGRYFEAGFLKEHFINHEVKGLIIKDVAKNSPFYKTFSFLYKEKNWKMSITGVKSIQDKEPWFYVPPYYQVKGEPSNFEEFSKDLSKYKPGDVIRLGIKKSYIYNETSYTYFYEYKISLGEKEPQLIPAQFGVVSVSSPKTFVVANDGSGDFKTIQVALLKSSPGDTILLRQGSYSGFEIPFSNRTIRGEGEKTVVEWIGIERVSDIKVENLSIIRETKEYSNLDIRKATNIFLRDLQIKGGYIAILIRDSNNIFIDHCKVSGAQYGICGSNARFKVSNSLTFNNSKRGLTIEEGSIATLESNTIVDNGESGLSILGGSQVEAYNNLFAFNSDNIYCGENPKYSGGYNNFFEGKLSEGIKKSTDSEEDPLFVNRLNGDYRLRPESPLVNKGMGGRYIGAFPPVGLEPGKGEFK